MTEASKPPNLKSVGYDDLLEDVFGLNIRGFRSLWVSFKNPKAYYKAAWDADWKGRFTPSFRLYFSLVALTFFFQFFWAGGDSATIASFVDQLSQVKDRLPQNIEMDVMAKTFARWYFAIMPFAIIFGLFILGLVYNAWGQKTPVIVRIRKTFVTIIPSTFFALFSTLILGLNLGMSALEMAALTIIPVVIIDGITAYRGAFPDLGTMGRLFRSIGLSFSILAATLASMVLAQNLASLGIAWYYS